MKKLLQRWVKKLLNLVFTPVLKSQDRLHHQAEKNAMLLAGIKMDHWRSQPNLTLTEAEFSVFSQWGADGIIQYLLQRVPMEAKTFVEFGVEDYRESNTRFLLMRDHWSGLVIDGSPENVQKIKQAGWFPNFDLTAVCSFINRENINALIGQRFQGDIGLLSVDIDGNDYWVWEAISVVNPRIVICEYNSLLGDQRAVVVPYAADFVRARAHHSNVYFGVSLPALCRLAEWKGYVFVGCAKAGNDAFFVRKDVAGQVTALTPQQGYHLLQAREVRDAQGHLTYVSGKDRLKAAAEMEIFDLDRQQMVKIAELCSP